MTLFRSLSVMMARNLHYRSISISSYVTLAKPRSTVSFRSNASQNLGTQPELSCTTWKTRKSLKRLSQITSWYKPVTFTSIDNLHISHNASGMGANIWVLLIRNSSSHSSLDVNGLELPCLAATICFTRLRNQW